MRPILSSSCVRRVAVAAKPAAIVLALLALVLFSDSLAAQGQAVQSGPQLPVAIWFVGAGILGLVIAYGIIRNTSRTRAEKRVTEQATKDLYAKEERDRVRSGAE